ncbi:4-methyl-5(B-hydroxyethyl)-thiazole monophosphate biosynthesis protein [Orenia metallireducens]|uniref:4-methyl-5(B-hydroxyethyl)-thiazole monophosphate biosynthesis protein n=1 Tax=Orenia metallireducens TaxID=1413210 RepID=A0A1C0A821_9FIRM|nr:DJ-1 family glyoxalase III [Orenia metallireducens]OCL26382.1 4-methyl-5(B-hydroxyethyl)-thiazole monophosphate biosynthesis protein [Orenia metallireducens]
MTKVLIPLAEGFEEIEAITNIDILRRAGLEVETASLGGLAVTGGHDIIIKADKRIDEVNSEDLVGIVLPGGMPGAANLRDDSRVISLIQELAGKEALIAAICAAPIVLEGAGVINNRVATSYPGFEQELESCNYLQDRVVVDGNIITGRGPGVAVEFALKLVDYLVGSKKVEELKATMLTNF